MGCSILISSLKLELVSISLKVMEAGRTPPHSPFNRHILSFKDSDTSVPVNPYEIDTDDTTYKPRGNHKIS